MSSNGSISTGSPDRTSPSSIYSNTIWSSIPSSSRVSEPSTSSGTVVDQPSNNAASSLVLSVDPALIDSSILSTFNPSRNNETELDALSFNSGISNSTISSCSVASVPEQLPHSFTNIERALLQLSAYENESLGCCSGVSANAEFRKKEGWWSRFRTEEDWQAFTEKATHYLSALVHAELMEMNTKGFERDRDALRIKSASNDAVASYSCERDSYSIAMWLQKIYKAITSVLGLSHTDLQTNNSVQTRMNYISYLVRELAIVEQRLNTIPPIPPTVPDAISLLDLSEDSRNLMIGYHSAWRRESIRERELLELKQSTCREEILSAIIETEEELFWTKNDRDNDKLGSYTDDGYFNVLARSPGYWGSIEDADYFSRKKCLSPWLLALTAGAAGIASFFLQYKRR